MTSGLPAADPTRVASNLALDQRVAERRARGETIVHLGFGESRLPVFPGLLERLVAGAHRTAYGPVAGDEAAREAVAGYFTRRNIPTAADQVVLAPGSKPLLMAVMIAEPGDVLLPVPCWVTYPPQVALAGRRPLGVPVPAGCGGVPDPDALRETIHFERGRGAAPRILVLTLPDNPTGTLDPPSLVREVCAIAAEQDLLVISDEIYRDLVHDPRTTPLLSPAEVVPDRTVVTTGLSKSHALGGWRIGAARFPAGDQGQRLRERVLAVASEVWSTLAGPMQEVAAYAFAEPPSLAAHIAAASRLHGTVAAAVHRIFVAAGALCRPPSGAFYVYPDLEPLRDELAACGCGDSASLESHLLDALGVAVLGGHHFGDDPRALRLRAATSLLYGDSDEQRMETLHAADPLRLPQVATQLATIEEALARLRTGGRATTA